MKPTEQLVKEVMATLRLSGMELSVVEVMWLNHIAEAIRGGETTADKEVEFLVNFYKSGKGE